MTIKTLTMKKKRASLDWQAERQHHDQCTAMGERFADVLERQASEERNAGHPALVHEPGAFADRNLVDPAKVERWKDDAEDSGRSPTGARREGEAGRGPEQEQERRRHEQELGEQVQEVIRPARELIQDADGDEAERPAKPKRRRRRRVRHRERRQERPCQEHVRDARDERLCEGLTDDGAKQRVSMNCRWRRIGS